MTSGVQQALDGRVVIVTGGGRGIGRAISELCAAAGARVVVVDNGGSLSGGAGGDDPAAETVAAITAAGGRALAFAADVTSEDDTKRMVATAVAEFGRLDGLVCCAGNFVQEDFVDTTAEQWDSIMRVHLRGQFLCTRAAADEMITRGHGRIVLFSSNAALMAPGIQSAYATAKAGVLGLALSASNALHARGVTVNAVMPGAATRMTDEVFTRLTPGPGVVASADASGTSRDPANVAPMIAYLLSDRAGHLSGQTYAVTGHQVTQVRPATFGTTIRQDERWTIEGVGAAVEREFSVIPPMPLSAWPPA
jgi:NAD(P)-dependent dehydrogenase (short-subunit alcohol dehydrogenase family)